MHTYRNHRPQRIAVGHVLELLRTAPVAVNPQATGHDPDQLPHGYGDLSKPAEPMTPTDEIDLEPSENL